jgi:integral membrane protein
VNPSTVRTIFRFVAFGEAVSWVLLLSAMLCKWVLETEPFGLREGGVPVAGMIHGAGFFLLYVLASFLSADTFKWSFKTLALALAASVPPFFSIWFEVAADRKGLLGREPVTV